MLPPSGFAPSFPNAPFAAPPARQLPPAVPARTQPGSAAQAQQAAPSRTLIRLQADDEPAAPARPATAETRRTALLLPPPEDLGIAAAPVPVGPDWAAAHWRLSELGAKCFHVDRLADGGCRVTCLLPTTQAGRTHRIEAQAGSEAAALALVLEQVEAWACRE